jgi:hypothetical protein
MNPYLLSALEAAPMIFERLLTHIPGTRIDEKLDPERFSPREVMAHLADWEPIFRERMRTAVEAPGSPIEAFDEGQRAIEGRYAESDPRERLLEFGHARRRTLELLRRLSREEMARTMVHPERGELSVYDYANMMIGHDTYHVEQLTRYLGEKTAGTW